MRWPHTKNRPVLICGGKYTLNLHKQTKTPPTPPHLLFQHHFLTCHRKSSLIPARNLREKRTREKELRSISAADVTQIFHLLMARALHWRRSSYIRRKKKGKKTSECAAQTLSGRRWEAEKGTTQQKLIAWFQSSDSFTSPYILTRTSIQLYRLNPFTSYARVHACAPSSCPVGVLPDSCQFDHFQKQCDSITWLLFVLSKQKGNSTSVDWISLVRRTRLPSRAFWKSGRRDWKSSCTFRCKSVNESPARRAAPIAQQLAVGV